jgi:hypothetical protein
VEFIVKICIMRAEEDRSWTGAFHPILVGVFGLARGDVTELPLSSPRTGPAETARPDVVVIVVSPFSLHAAAEVVVESGSPAAKASDVGRFVPILIRGLNKSALPASILAGHPLEAVDSDELEEAVGRIAAGLRCTQPIDMGTHRGAIAQLARLAEALDSAAASKRRRRRIQACAGATFAAAIALTTAYGVHYANRDPPEKIGFEKDMNGWRIETAAGARGCMHIERAESVAKSGRHALRADMDLDGTDSDRRSGELWVDLRQAGAIDLEARASTTGSRVTAWVSSPSAARGEPLAPNGFQLFVKDRNYRACYGPWANLDADAWLKVSLDPRCEAPNHHRSPGFDASSIAVLGLKMAIGDGSQARFSGSIYVDAIGW